MPDFDIDFCMDGRDRVIQHVTDRYGRQAVSQIITFGTMAAKAVVETLLGFKASLWLRGQAVQINPFRARYDVNASSEKKSRY